MPSLPDFHAFGGKRALLRSGAYATLAALGGARKYRLIEWSRVERIVFLCKGNICRSPFAEAVARKHGQLAISSGVDATNGSPASPDAIRIAAEFGVNLVLHRAIHVQDVELTARDLVVGFEPFHVNRFMSSKVNSTSCQITLLGAWLHPANLYIHDPYSSHMTYFRSCFDRINRAVEILTHRVKSS